MHIGIDARLYRSSAAGIGRYSQNLVKNILEIDHDNQYSLILTPEDAKEFEQSRINRQVKLIVTDIPHYSLAEQTKLPKILEKENFDLVHFLNFNFPVRYRGKFVVTIHDLTLFFYPGRQRHNIVHKLAYKYIFSQVCKKAQKIIAVSHATEQDIIKTFHVDKNKIKVVYEAADDKQFAKPSQDIIKKIQRQYAIAESLPSGQNSPVLLYVGQWRSHKNVVGLIKAFEKIRQVRPAKLAIVGKPDPAYPEIKATIDKSLFLSDIVMPGFVTDEELAAWYEIASVFVFPSFYEGFGLPGIEAMMAGTPVVASNRTSLPELYQDAAVYFNPEDLTDMANQIQKVVSDQKLRQKMIGRGREIAGNLSWRKTAAETLKVYQAI